MADTRRAWRIAGWIAASILIPLAVTVGGTLWATDIEEEAEIDRPLAETFLKDYYARVVQDSQVEQAYLMLTSEFKKNKASDISRYKESWKKYRQIAVASVKPVEGRNHFRVRLNYSLTNGILSREETTFHLQCIPWWERKSSPFRCKEQHIRIRDTFDTVYLER